MEQVDPKMVEKTLLRAAEILEAGWCRGSFCKATRPDMAPGVEQFVSSVNFYTGQPGVDSFCVQGAILRAVQEMEGLDYDNFFKEPNKLYFDNPLAAVAVTRVAGRLGLDNCAVSSPSGTFEFRSAVATWNDRVCNTAEEAADVCRRAATD